MDSLCEFFIIGYDQLCAYFFELRIRFSLPFINTLKILHYYVNKGVIGGTKPVKSLLSIKAIKHPGTIGIHGQSPGIFVFDRDWYE